MTSKPSPLLRQLRPRVRMAGTLLSTVHQIQRLAGSDLPLDEILRQVVDVLSRISCADACLLYLHDPKKQALILRASKRPHPKEIGRLSLKPGEGITGWVAQHKEPVAIPRRAYEDPRFKYFQSLPEDRYEAFLSLPIVVRGETIGVINLQHRRPRPHPPEEVLLCSCVALAVSGAIDRASLMEEARQARQALSERKIVERAKGLLMNRHRLSEEAAYRLLQKRAMDARKSLAQVAEAVLLAHDLNGKT